jgi:hypothetical protein
MNPIIEAKKNELLDNFDLNLLDIGDTFMFNSCTGLHQTKPAVGRFCTKAEALNVMINTVEGDYSQLSEDLALLAMAIDDLEVG